MYAVTYEADCLPLCPDIRGADIQFSGDLLLDATPDGQWTLDAIMVRTETAPSVGFRPVVGKERLPTSNPLYALIENAARAYDKRTGLISICVMQELSGADAAEGRVMAFYVGQRVVCVDASDNIPGFSVWAADPPVLGEVYTITGFGVSAFGRPSLLLAEIKNSATHGFGYRASRFRPVVERKTDISIFKAMLNPAKKAAGTVALLAVAAVIVGAFDLLEFMVSQ